MRTMLERSCRSPTLSGSGWQPSFSQCCYVGSRTVAVLVSSLAMPSSPSHTIWSGSVTATVDENSARRLISGEKGERAAVRPVGATGASSRQASRETAWARPKIMRRPPAETGFRPCPRVRAKPFQRGYGTLGTGARDGRGDERDVCGAAVAELRQVAPVQGQHVAHGRPLLR